MKKYIFRFYNYFRKIFGKTFLKDLPGMDIFTVYMYRFWGPSGTICEKVKDVYIYVNSNDLAIGKNIIENGIYEPYETELILNAVKEGDTFVDVGANIGYYSLLVASRIGQNGKVYSFEPVPDNYSLFEKSIKKNGFKNIKVFKNAVSDKGGENVKIYLDKENLGKHSMSRENVTLETIITTKTVTLDTVINEKINVMKIDVEGAEGLVLKGAKSILQQKSLTIFMEFFPDAIENVSKINPYNLINDLLNNFNIHMIDNVNKDTINITNITELKKVFSNKPNKIATNLILTKINT